MTGESESAGATPAATTAGTDPWTEPTARAAGVRPVPGGVTAPGGYRAAGVHCGLKRQKLDLALLVSDGVASAAAVFTANQVVAPPVLYCADLLRRSPAARVVVTNSGNANACTGEAGLEDARATAGSVARAVGCSTDEVLVCSTGVIGRRLDLAAIEGGVPRAVAALDATEAGGLAAAEAILTTDTRVKQAAAQVELAAGTVTVGGMAKGSGMIAPRMLSPAELGHATTLGFLTTDAVVEAGALQEMLCRAVDRSFHEITVDGDTSTNDTVILLANGQSGVAATGVDDLRKLGAAARAVALALALAVVRDGEGATRLLEVRVRGARSDSDAAAVARTVAESPLVKTAFCAGEPNWGRLMMAVGRAPAKVAPERVGIRVGDLEVVRAGLGTDHDPQELARVMTTDPVVIAIELGLADGSGRCFTCDLSEDYVRINARYLT